MSKCSRHGEARLTKRSAEGALVGRIAPRMLAAAALVGLIILLQPACLFKKHKASTPEVPPAPVRIAYLPLNVSSDNTNLRWLSLAVPILMAKASESAPDLETVPLWEAMPVAVEAAGNSRTLTAETAAYVASRLSAKWATQGDLEPAKGGVLLTVDFIPARTTLVPFRFQTQTSIDSLGSLFGGALDQFLRYLVVRPMAKGTNTGLKSDVLKPVVEALDREYGWFVTADPGKSNKIVADLVRSDNRLARLLFNPSLYPGMGPEPQAPKAGNPAAGVQKEGEKSAPAAPPAQPQPSGAASDHSGDSQRPSPTTQASAQDAQKTAQAQPEPLLSQSSPPSSAIPPFVPPPPKHFSQKLESAASATQPTEAAPGVTNRRAAVQPAVPPRSADHKEWSRGEPIKTGAADRLAPPAMNKASPRVQAEMFKVQISAVRSRKTADTIAGSLAKAGYSPEVAAVDLKDKGIWYRVRLQGYESRKAADAVGRKLLADKIIAQYWVIP